MTSCQYLARLRKVIATTERSIVIWDHRAKANNQSSIYVIKPLEHSPQCICLVPSKEEHIDSVLIGDDAGYINLLRLTPNDFAVSTNKDPKRALMSHVLDPTTLTIPILRRKFHPDWVLKVEYLPDIKSFASCSPSDKTSFVISEYKRLFDTQPVSELSITRGVNAFAYSEKSNIFATGGVDKIIRVWHPNILSRPTGKMIGHLFTVIAVVINDKDQHIISLSTARVFRIWDIHTLTCLQVFTDTEQKSGDRRISCMLFDCRHDRLFTGSTSIDIWPMTRTVQDTMSVPHSHDHPLTIVVKNQPLSQIISTCSESIIKVWEIDSGRQMYQILEAHGLGVEVFSVGVDSSGSRMVTGAYDGSLKVFEFSSGQEIKSFSLQPPREDDQTVMWISYINNRLNQTCHVDAVDSKKGYTSKTELTAEETVTRRILAVGWNNKLKEFEDSDDCEEIQLVREFSGVYEWPPSPPPSPQETVETSSIPDSDDGDTLHKKKKIHNQGEEERIPRKEDILLRHEITSCSLMDEKSSPSSCALLTGCSNGNVLVWDYKKGSITNVFELEKVEMPSRYDSRQRRMKESHPFRVNAIGGLCHKVFRPDPEEVKRRRQLRKKKLQEMEEVENPDKQGGENLEKVNAEDEEGDDPAEEVDIDMMSSNAEGTVEDGEGRKLPDDSHLVFDFEKEPIKMVELDFTPVVVSCHQDSYLRFWSLEGKILHSFVPVTKILSPITAMCSDEYAKYLIAADTKGYVTMWDVSEFLENPEAPSSESKSDLVGQIICWRAHLLKIISIVYVDNSDSLITASLDGSVRVWYPQRAHYIGYFGQHRVWYLTSNPSLPSSPVLPYDINEGPVKPVNFRSSRRKPQTKKYEYPLVFDAEKWKPFRRSAYDREPRVQQPRIADVPQQLNVQEVRNKKFFNALVKPKADKSNLESSKPAEPESGAIFRALPVYRLQTPPPHPRAPVMDFVTGGRTWEEDESSLKTPGKLSGGKVVKSRLGVKKINVTTVQLASGSPRRGR